MKYLGTFASEEEAARAFDQEALRLRGSGIELNLPQELEGAMPKQEPASAGKDGTHNFSGFYPGKGQQAILPLQYRRH